MADIATADVTSINTLSPTLVTRDHRGRPVGVLIALAVVLGLVLTAFALPAVNSAPRDVPIAIAGPASALGQVADALEARAPGSFSATSVADEAALEAAIRDRDVYGGIVITATGPKVLTAPAASPAVAQGLSALAAGLAQESGAPVPVEQVVPLPSGDERGVGLGAALLPLLIGSITPVIAMTRVLRGRWAQLAGVLSAAVVLGATLAGLLRWYGVFEGSWLLAAGAMAALIAAMSTALLGLRLSGGWPAFGVGVATFMLLGNPLSGLATAPEFLPEPWPSIGAWLPPGAGGQLLRSAAYFDGAGSGRHLVVLGCWFALGLVLVTLAARSPRRPA